MKQPQDNDLVETAPGEVRMVRVAGDQYMSEDDAYAKGYAPRLDPPIKGEPFFPPGALWNFLGIVAVIALGMWMHKWIGAAVHSVFSVFR